jgi:FMN-dependent NADH-azoreductase
MSLFRLDASIRTAGSHSREIADIVENEWQQNHPSEQVVRRDLAQSPIPAEAWVAAVSAGWTPAEARTAEQDAAVALAAKEVDRLLEGDELLFAAPLYNYGVSQHFKAWVDLVLTDPRMAPGGVAAVAGRPAVLVVVRGGGYGPGSPREGWDHGTGWIRRMLADAWDLDLQVVETELTLAGVAPGMDAFVGVRDELRASANDAARRHGKALSAAAA